MRTFAFALFLLLVGPGWAQSLELVESFPVETDFDQPDLRSAQDVWLEMIEGAQSEILWQTFYVSHEKGKATEPLLAALKTAAARGVRVQLLVDPKFLETYPEPLGELGATEGIEVRSSPVGHWFGGVMHAKAMFCDGKVGYIGSQNLDWRSLTHIRELGLRFEEPHLVADYTRVFRWEWDNFDQEKPPADLPRVVTWPVSLDGGSATATFSPVGLNAASTLSDEEAILKLIESADSSIEIALLDYSPVTRDGKTFYPTLDNALRQAAVRGVKIRLLVSHWMEEETVLDHVLSLNSLNNVEVRACRIPLSSEGEIPFARVHHSKYMVVDGESAWLGTANWARGYLHNSRNYGMVLQGGKLPARMERLFDFDWARSTLPVADTHL